MSTADPLARALVCTGLQSDDPEQIAAHGRRIDALYSTARGTRCLGSPALCLAYVAAGRIDAFLERDATYAWDVAAGALMIAEAGGRCEDLDGGPLNFGHGVANVLGTNGASTTSSPTSSPRPTTLFAERTLLNSTTTTRSHWGCGRGHELASAARKGGAPMADVVPVDQFLEWYPGWKPEHIDNPWLRMKSGPFTKADEDNFWFVDFHWPRGFSPLGFSFVTDAAWSTQLAAHTLPLPPAGGLVQRMGGPFLYEGEVPVTSAWEIGYRAARIEKNMPRFLQNFDSIWDERKWELELGLRYFEGYDFAGKSLAELGQFMLDARTFQQRAWEIHFEIMYPLLAIYLQLYGVCASNGIDPGKIAKMFQGRDTKIMETDRAMWDLADEAKRLGIADHFEHEPERSATRSPGAGGNASVWLTKFDDFL